jgi:hypothetical protein
MSTIKVDTYQTRGGASEIAIDKLKGVTAAGSMLVVGEGGTTTTNLQQGLCKAWVKLNGTGTVAINNSFNTSGITDEATGHYSHSFTNNFADAHYVGSGSAMFSTNNNLHVITIGDNNGAGGTVPSTSSYELRSPYVAENNAGQDCTIVSIGNVGDLA